MLTLDSLLDFQEQICYVQCGFCTTILLVSVPKNSLSMAVTVRCGHCTTILSVDITEGCFVPLHFFSSPNQQQEMVFQPEQEVSSVEVAAEKKAGMTLCFTSDEEEEEDEEDPVQFNQVNHRPPEKKQRAPSAYNHFIREEIKRLKIEYPNMTHKQAFSAAAKNWAHSPQSQCTGGGVQGNGEADKKMHMYSDVDKEVPCSGSGSHETKAFSQPICSKKPLC